MPKRMHVHMNTCFEHGVTYRFDIDIVTSADAQIPANGELIGCGQTVRAVLDSVRDDAAKQLQLPKRAVEVVSHSFYRL